MPTRSGTITVQKDVDSTWATCADITRLPEFIAGINSCTPQPDGSYEWVGRAFGVRRTWRSTWIDHTAPSHIAWRTDDPMVPDGELCIDRVDSTHTRVTITMHYHPQTMLDRVLVNRAATRVRLWWDLRCFQRWAERQPALQGATTATPETAAAVGASNAD